MPTRAVTVTHDPLPQARPGRPLRLALATVTTQSVSLAARAARIIMLTGSLAGSLVSS